MRLHKSHDDNPQNSNETALQHVEFIFKHKYGEVMPELLSKFIALLDMEKEEWGGVKVMIECVQEFREWKKKSQTLNDKGDTCEDFEQFLFSPDRNVIVIQGGEGTMTSKAVIQGVADPQANREICKEPDHPSSSKNVNQDLPKAPNILKEPGGPSSSKNVNQDLPEASNTVKELDRPSSSKNVNQDLPKAPNTLKVKIYMGIGWDKDFPKSNRGSSPDLIVNLAIYCGKIQKTKVHKSSWTPCCGEESSFSISSWENDVLVAEVYDHTLNEKFAVGLPHAIGARDTFWRDLPKIAVLRQQSWGDFSLDRIERQRERIARVDWMSNEPFVEGKGKRLPLPIMGKIPKAYPNYSEILRAQLSGGNFGSVSSLKDKEAEAQISSPGKIRNDERGTESQGLPIENANVMTIDPSASESADPTLSASPLKRKEKKKKKKSKSSKEMVIDSGEGGDLVGKNTAAVDQSVDREKEPEDLAEEGQTALPISKRKDPTDGGSLDHGGKRLKKACDNSSRSSSEIALSASRLLPWGELGPPSDRLALAVSERWAFRHDKDGPLVGDPSACAELVRQIRGGTQLMPETPTLAFPDRFAESAQADVEAIFRKNQLIADYELALRKMASDFASAEATIEAKEMEIEELKQAALVIEAKDVEIEKLKQAALVKSKEIVDERTRFYRERKQAKQTSDDLEEELETARSKVAELKAEAEDLKKTMEFARQVHRRDLASQTSRIAAAANECFDKFKRYMVDRDRREKKLILHSEASGTLGSMDVLKDFGTSIPKELIDTLTANEANFRREMEEVTVEAITEHDFILPRFSGPDVSSGANQSDEAMNASSSDKVV